MMFHTRTALAQAGINSDLIDLKGLCSEYGLQLPHFNLLEFIVREGQVSWPDDRLQEISGAPANALRKLVDLGLLEGPARQESIRARPFRLIDQGREVLAKIRRGLHRPEWITDSRARAIGLIDQGVTSTSMLRRVYSVRHITLVSLKKNGYVGGDDREAEGDEYIQNWYLTALGREAWEEYQAWQKS